MNTFSFVVVCFSFAAKLHLYVSVKIAFPWSQTDGLERYNIAVMFLVPVALATIHRRLANHHEKMSSLWKFPLSIYSLSLGFLQVSDPTAKTARITCNPFSICLKTCESNHVLKKLPQRDVYLGNRSPEGCSLLVVFKNNNIFSGHKAQACCLSKAILQTKPSHEPFWNTSPASSSSAFINALRCVCPELG